MQFPARPEPGSILLISPANLDHHRASPSTNIDTISRQHPRRRHLAIFPPFYPRRHRWTMWKNRVKIKLKTVEIAIRDQIYYLSRHTEIVELIADIFHPIRTRSRIALTIQRQWEEYVGRTTADRAILDSRATLDQRNCRSIRSKLAPILSDDRRAPPCSMKLKSSRTSGVDRIPSRIGGWIRRDRETKLRLFVTWNFRH
jgi:hypothetical protein